MQRFQSSFIMVDIRYVYLILKYHMIFIGSCIQICYSEIDFQSNGLSEGIQA